MTGTLQDQSKPFGLNRVMLTGYTDTDGTVLDDTSYPLPVSQTLAFSVQRDTVQLDGDDKAAVAVANKGKTIVGSLEGGGVSLQIWSLLTGGRVTVEGVAPNRTRTFLLKGSDEDPYFRVDGLSRSKSGGDMSCRIFRCKCNGKTAGDMKYGAFQMTSADFTGTPLDLEGESQDDYLFQFRQHESRTQLPTTPEPNPVPIPSNLAVGTIAATTVALSWNALSTADSYKVQQSTDGINWTAVTTGHGGTPSSASTTVTNLTASTQYYFRVAGVFGAITGDYSSSVTATTLAS
jgi:hypothetical protein